MHFASRQVIGEEALFRIRGYGSCHVSPVRSLCGRPWTVLNIDAAAVDAGDSDLDPEVNPDFGGISVLAKVRLFAFDGHCHFR